MANQSKFVWYDISADNVDNAIDFYTNVLQWGTQDYEQSGDETYVMWTADGSPMGGFMQLQEEERANDVPPHWMGYVGVDDLEEKLGQLEELDGERVTDPIDIGDAGQFCVVQDPQGAIFALHQSKDGGEMEAPAKNTPGMVSWVELMCDDVDAAWDFYSELFGWHKGERMEPRENVPYQLFGWDDEDWGGIGAKPPGAEMPSNWIFYVTVENIDAAIDRVHDNGGEVFNGPMEVPGGDRIAHCKDPEGAMFALQCPAKFNA